MSTISSKLLNVFNTKNNLKTAIANKGIDISDSTLFSQYANLIKTIDVTNQQDIKTVVPSCAGMEIVADDPYTEMLKVILKGEPNFQPYNIRTGVEIWGKIGTAFPADTLDIEIAYGDVSYNNYALEVI